MTTYARIVAGQAVDVTIGEIAELFHPELAVEFVQVPGGTQNGYVQTGNTWAAPAPPAPVAASLPLLTPMSFYLAFTPAERIAIKKSTDEEVQEFWASYQLAVQLDKPIDPNLKSVSEGVAYLAQQPGPGILASPDRIAQILAGMPQ